MKINSNKLLYYSGNVLIFTMYWAMFAAATNWWIGFILATSILVLQELIRRNVKIQ